MKEFARWLKDNLSHLFSLIGIVLTIYFSIFYVPQYAKDLELKRIAGMHGELVSTIQELVYNKHLIDQHDIETLIKGKELRSNSVYPYSVNELLVQVQESFLSNKFIPLESRKELVETVDELRSQIMPSETTTKEKKSDSLTFWVSAVSILLGIISAYFGSVSLFQSAKRLRDDEVEEKITEQKDLFQSKIRRAISLEEFVGKKLTAIFGESNIEKESGQDLGVDFVVTEPDGSRKLAVEVKYTETGLIPLRTLNQIGNTVKRLNIPVVLVTNAELTPKAKHRFELLNKEIGSSRIHVLGINDLERINELQL